MRPIPIYEYLVFNGRSSLDFGVRVSGGGTYKGAERDTEVIEVAGRNGELTLDNGRYKNVLESYECFIVDDFQRNIENFRDFMLQDSAYHRLTDTYHPDEYRMAKYVGPFDPEVYFNLSGQFSIQFSRLPQRWLIEGENPITITAADGSVELFNPTMQPAKPMIIVTQGTGQIGINSTTMTLNANNGGTVIDCESENAYEGATNRNKNLVITGKQYPVLPAGKNHVRVGAGMTIQIIPRWWRL